MRAIETVGVITTIVIDKTGTLTKNILTVQEVWTLNPKNDIKKVIAYFANHGDGKSYDSLDMAINTYAKRHNASVRGLSTMELPFNQEAAMSATVWHYGKNYHTYYKGAPESIMNACRVPKVEAKKIAQALEELTSHGYRVVVVAATEKTNQLLYAEDFIVPTAIVMGTEDVGVSSAVLKVVDSKAKLPMVSDISSLNVSVACAVFLYEVLKQRL